MAVAAEVDAGVLRPSSTAANSHHFWGKQSLGYQRRENTGTPKEWNEFDWVRDDNIGVDDA